MVLVFVLFYLVKNIQGRFTMHDLEVDYIAAQRLLDGQPIYDQAFGLSSGLYKYSPSTLFL